MGILDATMQPLRPAARGRRGPPTTTIAESALLVFLLALLVVGAPLALAHPALAAGVAVGAFARPLVRRVRSVIRRFVARTDRAPGRDTRTVRPTDS